VSGFLPRSVRAASERYCRRPVPRFFPRTRRRDRGGGAGGAGTTMSLPILNTEIRYEQDVVSARQRTRQIAALLGFDTQQQTRLATAVSEIARNAFQYGGGGQVEFSLEGSTAPQILVINVVDQGRGIHDVDRILNGEYASKTGMGLGIVGARRLMDRFEIQSSKSTGTRVSMCKLLPRKARLITTQILPQLTAELMGQGPSGLMEEIRQQNTDLLRALDDLR